MYKRRLEKEYILYEGDNPISFGTIKEIANHLNIQEKSVKKYLTKIYLNNIKYIKNKDKIRYLKFIGYHYEVDIEKLDNYRGVINE